MAIKIGIHVDTTDIADTVDLDNARCANVLVASESKTLANAIDVE
jgi:hypothetical protein